MDEKQSLARMRNHIGTSDPSQALSLRERTAIARQASGIKVLLLDTSYSMTHESAQGERRIDTLWSIVQDLRSQGLRFSVCEFNSDAQWSDSISKPRPTGGTDLAGALDFLTNSGKHLVSITLITDGQPDDGETALVAAALLKCKINVLYAGGSYNIEAKSFCRQLAEATGGKYAEADVSASEMLALEAATSAKLMLSDGGSSAVAL